MFALDTQMGWVGQFRKLGQKMDLWAAQRWLNLYNTKYPLSIYAFH